jgi:hypothetical protein
MSVSVINQSINYGDNAQIIVTDYNSINVSPLESVVSIVESGYDFIITVNPKQTTLYLIDGFDILGNSLNLSATIYVNVTIITNPITTNYNTAVNLDAFGSNKYLWYPSTYLNVNNSESVICTPLENITYTILGTDTYGVQSTTNLMVNVNTFMTFNPIKPEIFDGNLLNISVNYNNPNFLMDSNLIEYKWISYLFTGLPQKCIYSKNGETITLHPYQTTSYTVNAYYNNNIISSDKIEINVIEKPSKIIDVDIIPYRLKDAVFSKNKKELIALLLKYKQLSKKIIDFYYTTLQTAYRMEFTNKSGIPFKVKWITLYQIKNKSNEMILSFNQQWRFFQYINNLLYDSNFKYLLNTVNELFLEKPQKILVVPLGTTTNG